MADLVRAFDWSGTLLGPIETWSKELLSIVNVVLASPVPCFVYWGSDLLMIYNDAARLIAGSRHPEALGASAREVWKEAWHIVGPQVEEAMSQGKGIRRDGALVPLKKDGGLQDLYWNYSYSPVFERGEVGGVLLICQDITGTVLAVQKLRDSEAQANRILQSIGDGVLVTDIDTRVIEMNSVAEELTGWRLDEAMGRRLTEVLHIVDEATREIAESPADQVKRQGVAGLPTRAVLVSRQGTETYVASRGAPIFDEGGELSGVVLVCRNINERRKVEREREVLTLRLDQILEATTDAVAILDRNWRFTYLNKRGREIVQGSGDVIGKDAWKSFPSMIYPGSPYVWHYHRAMDEGVSAEFDAEYPEPFNIALHICVEPSSEGIIIFFRDITEQRRRDALLMQTEKLAAVGRMASSIAHEINNPLEAITNLLYIARHSTDLDEMHSMLDTADEELRRVANIVNQTLRFHRQVKKPEAIDCHRLVSSVLNMYQSRLRNTGVMVELRKRAVSPVVGYEGDIRQVLNNVVGNAIDAMPEGGRLVIQSHEGTDWRSGRRGVLLSVGDAGMGMDKRTMAKIYEAFFTTKGLGGTGLGLWVSAQIMERHKGRIRIRSCQRKGRNGTVIMLFLPFDGPKTGGQAQI